VAGDCGVSADWGEHGQVGGLESVYLS
jgi:hypothetical protein